MDGNKKTAVQGLIIEAGIAGFLVILILITLNYFNILPISDSFSFLSFLPRQGAAGVQVQNGSGTRMKLVVRPVNPLLSANGTKNTLFTPIASSSVNVTRQFRIETEVSDNGGKASTLGGGLTIKNTKKFSDNDYRHLRIFYYPKNKNWLLEARSKNKSQFFFLTRAPLKGANFEKITLIVNSKGDGVTVLVPGIPERTFKLNDSLYDAGSQLNALISTPSKSEFDLYSLSYEY